MKVIQLQNNTAVLSDTQFDMYLKIKSFYEERNVEQMLSSQLLQFKTSFFVKTFLFLSLQNSLLLSIIPPVYK